MSDTTRIKTSNYAHIVDRLMPSGGFRSKSDAILTFHRARTLKRLQQIAVWSSVATWGCGQLAVVGQPFARSTSK
jgi:hypothetical protein